MSSLTGRQPGSATISIVPGLAGKFFAGDWRSTIATGDIGSLPLSSSVSFGGSGASVYASQLSYSNVGNYYGFIALGYFTPPTTGVYTFYTNSYDGSGVWIGDIARADYGRTSANALVNNGLGSAQSTTKRSGAITLTANVKYPIRIVHETRTGTETFTFSWKGPSIVETTSLASYFSTQRIGVSSYGFWAPLRASGLAGKFFAGSWRSLASTGDIGTLPLTSEVKYGSAGSRMYSSIAYSNVGESYGFLAVGYFRPPITGTYTFFTNATNGSGLWIGNVAVVASGRLPGNATVNNSLGSGQALTKRSGSIALTAGIEVPLRIVHEETTGTDSFAFSWSGPTIPENDSLEHYFSAFKLGSSLGYWADAPFYPPGQQEYTSPGTYTWTAPNVYSVSVVAVGGGGGGVCTNNGGGGGGGGGLGWKIVPVVPGTSYTVVVGSGGSSTSVEGGQAGNGQTSYFSSIATVAGYGGSGALGLSGGAGGTYAGDGGGAGGSGGAATTSEAGGGGGGGGYSGGGGSGGSGGVSGNGGATAGSGGGGGGGGKSVSTPYGAGGGVGIYGQGTNGAAASSSNDAGQGGSGGTPVNNTTAQAPGGTYGGGGSGGDSVASGANGGAGAVRILWGAGRAYPSANTASV